MAQLEGCRRGPVPRGFTRTQRGRRRRDTKGVGALISAPGARLVALHRPASIRTAYFRSPHPPDARFHERPSDRGCSAFDASARRLVNPSLFPTPTTRSSLSLDLLHVFAMNRLPKFGVDRFNLGDRLSSSLTAVSMNAGSLSRWLGIEPRIFVSCKFVTAFKRIQKFHFNTVAIPEAADDFYGDLP